MPKKKTVSKETVEETKGPDEGSTFLHKGQEPIVDLNPQYSPNVEVPVTPTSEAQLNVETNALMKEAKEEEDTDKVRNLDNVPDATDLPNL